MKISKRHKGELLVLHGVVVCVVFKKILYVSIDARKEDMLTILKYEARLLKEKRITGTNYDPVDFVIALLDINIADYIWDLNKDLKP